MFSLIKKLKKKVTSFNNKIKIFIQIFSKLFFPLAVKCLRYLLRNKDLSRKMPNFYIYVYIYETGWGWKFENYVIKNTSLIWPYEVVSLRVKFTFLKCTYYMCNYNNLFLPELCIRCVVTTDHLVNVGWYKPNKKIKKITYSDVFIYFKRFDSSAVGRAAVKNVNFATC